MQLHKQRIGPYMTPRVRWIVPAGRTAEGWTPKSKDAAAIDKVVGSTFSVFVDSGVLAGACALCDDLLFSVEND